MTTIEDILDSIDNRLRVLNGEIDTLTAARAALDGRDPRTSKSPRGRVAKSGRPTRREDPAAKTTTAERRNTASGAREASAQKPRQAARRKPRAKAVRAADVVPAGKLEVLLAETDGLTTSAVANKANGDRDQVATLLRELERAGRIRRTGERRATRWHAITDEERIQQRAAELAARSKPAAA